MVVLPNGARLGKGWAGSGYLTEPVKSKKKKMCWFFVLFFGNVKLLSLVKNRRTLANPRNKTEPKNPTTTYTLVCCCFGQNQPPMPAATLTQH